MAYCMYRVLLVLGVGGAKSSLLNIIHFEAQASLKRICSSSNCRSIGFIISYEFMSVVAFIGVSVASEWEFARLRFDIEGGVD